jgi:hypothetical protein
MATTPRIQRRVLVQLGNSLADDAWISDANCVFLGGSEGQGQIIGDALFERHYGRIVMWGTKYAQDLVPYEDQTGMLVRLLLEDDAGTVTQSVPGLPSGRWTPFWHGKVTAPDEESGGNSRGVQRWRCAGLSVLLLETGVAKTCVAALTPTGTQAGLVAAWTFKVNEGGFGNRSGSQGTVDGRSTYYQALANGEPWTALDVIRMLLVANTDVDQGWTISDPQGVLTYRMPEYDLASKTVFGVLNDLTSNRGLTWWVEVSAGKPAIVVASAVSAPVVVGAYTVPANASQWDLNSADPWISGLRVNTDADQVADIIEVRGRQSVVALTFKLALSGGSPTADSNAAKGWDENTEANWSSWDAGSVKSEGPPAGADWAWRRIVPKLGWAGNTQGSTTAGIRLVPVNLDPGPDYGEEGDDGDRKHEALTANPDPRGLVLERSLPCSYAFGSDPQGPRKEPIVVSVLGTSFQDRSGSWGVSIDQTPPAIYLNDGKGGTEVRAILTGGGSIYITVAIREPEPLRLYWRRPRADWPCAHPRRRVVNAPMLGRDIIAAGAVTGINSAYGIGTALTTVAETVELRNDLEDARKLLAHAVAYYAEPAITATWTDRGVLDISPGKSTGTMLRRLTAADGYQFDVGAIVTRRRWSVAREDGGSRWDTTYETDIVYPNLEAVL